MPGAGGREVGGWGVTADGDQVSFCGDGIVLERFRGDGYTTLWVYSM